MARIDGKKPTVQSSGLLRPYAPALVELNRVFDAGWIALALWVACAVRGLSWLHTHTLLVLVAIGIFWLAANHLHLYRSWRISPLRAEIVRLWACWAIASLGVVFIAYGLEPMLGERESLPFLWFSAGFIVLGGTRAMVRMGLRRLRLRGRNFRAVAIVGATPIGREVERTVEGTVWMGLRMIGYFDDRQPAPGRTDLEGIALKGTLRELTQLASRGEVDIVYIALPLRAEMRIKRLMAALSDTTASVVFVPDFSNFDLLNARWDTLGSMPVLSIVESPFHGMSAGVKRATDVCVSLAVLAFCAVPMLAIAAAIKLTSPGPVIFRQRRYGLNGKAFEIWKFRTMTVCEDGDQYRQATRHDARVTPLGAILRRTSLDELPQFLNVLQGRMSIVGPRPHPVAMTERQRALVDRYMLRHKVKPGLTGWAQVNGFRGETETFDKIEGRIRLDLEYINDWSLWMDIKIMLMTFGAVVKGENAY